MDIGKKIWRLIEKILRIIIYSVLRINLSENAWDSLIQFVKFGIVGVSNTILSYVIYVVVLGLFRKLEYMPLWDIYLSQFISFVISVAWSFYWNNKMVFTQKAGEKRHILRSLAKTYVAYAFTGFFLAEILLHFWTKVLGINEFIAPIISLILTVPLNFIIQKFWAFRK